MTHLKRRTKKVLIAIIGGIVLLVGLIAIPYPGPGWLIVFTGLAILATEFAWAQRLLEHARGRYDIWMSWLKRQNIVVRLLVVCFTGIVVIVTIWLMNGYGLIDNWLDLHQSWVHSPLSK